MRQTRDRIRHAISFELIGLALVTPLGAVAFNMPGQDIGVVGIVGATVATGWNYLYNLLFDHALLRTLGDLNKSMPMRVFHSILFEAGLLAILLPFIAWYLSVSLLQAVWMDLSYALFFVFYAFFFNWSYDRIFPIPSTQGDANTRSD